LSERNIYKVSLSLRRVEYVEADRHESDGVLIRFYRKDNDTPVAQYSCAQVRGIAESTAAERGPGILQTVVFCLVAFATIFGTGYSLLWLMPQLMLGGWETIVPISSLIGWTVALVVGLRWNKLSFREACPLTRFPLGIVPALLAATFSGAILAQWFSQALDPAPLLAREHLAWLGLGPVTAFLTAVLVAPLMEEFVFRGLILRGYLIRYSLTTVFIANAAFFALAHLNVPQALFSLPISLACIWLFLRTRSLLPGIICHAFTNITTIFLLPPLVAAMQYKGGSHAGIGRTPGFMIAIAVPLLALGALVLWYQLRTQAVATAPASGPFVQDDSPA
jgi:membrane protease YdiL (CAAX protease family)